MRPNPSRNQNPLCTHIKFLQVLSCETECCRVFFLEDVFSLSWRSQDYWIAPRGAKRDSDVISAIKSTSQRHTLALTNVVQDPRNFIWRLAVAVGIQSIQVRTPRTFSAKWPKLGMEPVEFAATSLANQFQLWGKLPFIPLAKILDPCLRHVDLYSDLSPFSITRCPFSLTCPVSEDTQPTLQKELSSCERF